MVVQSIFGVSLLAGSSFRCLLFLYTDPGSGALVWQLVLASIIGGAFYTRLVIRRLKSRLAGWKKAGSAVPTSLSENHRAPGR